MKDHTCDKNLEAAATEIDAILAKYQLAGSYGLASANHAAFQLSFPEWSMIQFKEGKLSFKMIASHPELLDASAYLVYALEEISNLHASNLMRVESELEKRFQVIHKTP